MTRSFLAFFVVGLLTTVGCDQTMTNVPPGLEKTSTVSMDDVQRDTAAALETTAAYSQQSKDKLVRALKGQLAIMDANIEKLRLKGQGLANDAKANWDQKMSELEVKRKSANTKLQEVEDSTAEAWNDVEKGVQSVWEELKKAFQNASNEFKTQQ